MAEFLVKGLVATDIEAELEKVGFDIAYRAKASDKFKYKTFKIFDLTLPQANILKQTALSFGADCGLHRDVLTSKIEKTDVILGGSYSQLKKICKKLEHQPFSLKLLSSCILNQLEISERKTRLVGIVNLTPDSFSNDGIKNPERAFEHIQALICDGADMIDIGAESTRPGALPVDVTEQIKRLEPVLLKTKNVSIPISVDTRSSQVAKFALENGAQIINDVSGMDYDPQMADIIAEYNAGIIIQHSLGIPENMQDNPNYKDVVEEVYKNLYKKVKFANTKGINNIIIDIGIGFGKTKEHNFELLNRIEEFYSLGLPVMVGLSRKSLLGIGDDDNALKDSLSAALAYPLMLKNIDYLRVHNVKLHKELLDLAR